MLRGIYSAASGMLANQTKMDVIAQNLANVNTPGYKRETTISQSFQSLLVERINDRPEPGQVDNTPTFVGPMGLGTFIANTATRLTAGPLQATGNPLDVAIRGDGFFVVQTANGLRYTRQGNFQQSADGRLVTVDGLPVLLQDGTPAQAAPGEVLSIGRSGEVKAGDRVLGQLQIAASTQLGPVTKEGAGLWRVADGGETAMVVGDGEAGAGYQLEVGFIEQSNVNPITEMVEMIATMRAYEAAQRTIQTQDETLRRAVNDVGRI
jgi:flagellar basal-body rod protein FlgF